MSCRPICSSIHMAKGKIVLEVHLSLTMMTSGRQTCPAEGSDLLGCGFRPARLWRYICLVEFNCLLINMLIKVPPARAG